MKRLRPVNSCLPCRRRRLKCNKERPTCSRCFQSHQQCIYDESAVTTSSGENGQSADQGNLASDSSRSPDPTRSRSDLNDSGRFLFSSGGRTTYTGATFWGNAVPTEIFDEEEYLNIPGVQNHNPSLIGKQPSPQKPNKTVSWTTGPFRPPANSGLEISPTLQSQCRLCGRSYHLSCVQAMLPSKEVSTKLCEIFFGAVFPLIPILHIPSFQQDYDDLWKELETHRPGQETNPALILRRKPGLICLLSAIFFSAVNSASNAHLTSALGANYSKVSIETYYLAAMVSATITGFPRRPTLYTLAAYIYIQSQFAREEDFRDAPEFISMSFRLSIGMGLHRQLSNQDLSLGDLETRRKIWWYVLHLDVMTSCSSGLSPLFIDEKMANAKMIEEYDEHTNEAGESSRQRDVRYIVAANRYETTKEIRGILRLHFEEAYDSQERIDETVTRLNRLAQQISQACSDLLGMCLRCSLPDASFPERSDTTFSRVWKLVPGGMCDREVMNFSFWSVILLHMMVHKAFCVLYHPLFTRTDVHESVRIRAVKHAQSFLGLFIRLCNGPESERYHWMYPGTYQPLQAVSLLVADLLQRPRSDDSELSRGIIDRLFEMYDVDHGIVNQDDPVRRDLSAQGKNAWTMLVRARRKALELVGEDPHVLLPSVENEILSDVCICGERIGLSMNDQTQRERPHQQQQTNDTGMMEEVPQRVFVDASMTHEPFDWHEFDAIAGASSGFLS